MSLLLDALAQDLTWRNSMTELGKERVAACSFTSSEGNLFCTMNWARSPTILLLGVTWLWLEDSAPQ